MHTYVHVTYGIYSICMLCVFYICCIIDCILYTFKCKLSHNSGLYLMPQANTDLDISNS